MSQTGTDTNPFADPSIEKATGPAFTETSVTNYNPFTEESSATATRSNQSIVESATADFGRQQESLEKAADRIETWEPNYQQRAIIQSERIKNYPPLPGFCPCKPCFHQDISGEIPAPHQRVVRFHFFFWIAYTILLGVNVAGCVAYFIFAKNQLTAGISLAVSFLYFFLWMPCSYVCWFRPLYSAFRTDNSLSFFWYFIIFLIQIIILVLDSIGIIYYGTVGWMHAAAAFDANRSGLGIFFIVIALLFDALAVIGFIFMILVNKAYRNSPATFEQAKVEFGQKIASNRTVQQTAVSAATGATQSATQSAWPNNSY